MAQDKIAGADAVTASALVRNFGVWQDRALQTPVYILHHGRPRLVLTTVEGVTAPLADRAGHEWHGERETILEAIDDLIALLDTDGTIRDLGARARGYFGVARETRQPYATLFGESAQPIVRALVDRVRASGLTESVEVRSGRHRDRRLEVQVMRCDGGLLALARDRTLVEERALAAAQIAAIQSCTSALGSIGIARINAQGYITYVSPSFEHMAGLSAAALHEARLVTLIDVASRVAVSEAFEQAMRGGQTATADATLLVNTGPPRRVRIAMSPMMEFVLALIELRDA